LINLAPFIHNGSLLFLGKELPSPTSLSIDSRKVEEGGLFVAIPGNHHDGTRFIEEALRSGAMGVIVPHGLGQKMLEQFQEKFVKTAAFSLTPSKRCWSKPWLEASKAR